MVLKILKIDPNFHDFAQFSPFSMQIGEFFIWFIDSRQNRLECPTRFALPSIAASTDI
jgi:hypothetical protein